MKITIELNGTEETRFEELQMRLKGATAAKVILAALNHAHRTLFPDKDVFTLSKSNKGLLTVGTIKHVDPTDPVLHPGRAILAIPDVESGEAILLEHKLVNLKTFDLCKF